eukprot:g1029.t1
MPVLSKPEKDVQRQLLLVNIHMMANVSLSLLCFNTRTVLLAKLVKGDPKRMAKYLAAWSSSVGLAEFILNPTVGALSDAYGRKLFMMMSPAVNIVLKSLVLLKPSLLTLTIEKIFCDATRTMAGSTMSKAAICDIVSGEDLGAAIGQLYTWAGASVTIAPLVAAYLQTRKGGSWRQPYTLAALLALVTLCGQHFFMEDTLPEASRVEFHRGCIVSPFSLSLFSNGRKLALLSLISMAHFLVEPKNLTDSAQLLQMNELKWSTQQMSNYTSAIGIAMFFAGPIGRRSLKHFGISGHTTATNLLTIITFALKGSYTSTSIMWATMLLSAFCESRNNGIMAEGSNIAKRKHILPGQYNGLVANLRAACVFFAPFLYGKLYSLGLKM